VSNPNPRYRYVTCHLLRHSFARQWKAKNGSIESLSKILGHASPATTLTVYGTESLTEVRRNYDSTMRRIWRWPSEREGGNRGAS
jgi:integrase